MLCVCTAQRLFRHHPRTEAELESLFLLVPIALIFVAIALKVFFWAIKSGQYDNLDTEAHRILFDDDEPISRPDIEPEPPSKNRPSAPPGESDNKPS